MSEYIEKLTKKSPSKAKIVSALFGGLALGFTYHPSQQIRIINKLKNDWKDIDRRALRRNLYGLERDGIVKRIKRNKNEIFFELTGKGINSIEQKSIKKEKWDKKWRIVVFDIPEKERWKRDIFRNMLLKIGFLQLQQSVWVYPHECYEDIFTLAKDINAEEYLSYIVAEKVSKEKLLREKFKV